MGQETILWFYPKTSLLSQETKSDAAQNKSLHDTCMSELVWIFQRCHSTRTMGFVRLMSSVYTRGVMETALMANRLNMVCHWLMSAFI